MKILHLASYYMEGMGYQENCLPHAQKDSIALGGDVTFVTSERSYPFANFDATYKDLLGDRVKTEGIFYDKGLKIYRLRPLFENIKRTICFFNPYTLYKVLKQEEVNVVHLHGATNLNVISLLVISLFLDFKLFVDNHADSNNSNVKSNANKVFYFFFSLLYKVFSKKVSQFLPVTPSSSLYLINELKVADDKISLTPLCFDHNEMFYDELSANKLRKKLGLSIDNKVVGYIGKISPEKCVLEALEIFKEVHDFDHSVRFLMVGSGNTNYLEEIDKFITKNALENSIVYLPMQNRSGLRACLSLLDIGFWFGTASNTIQESMGCKAIPMLSNSLVTNHLLFDKRQVVDSSDLACNVSNVISLLNDPSSAEAVQAFALDKFTWETSAVEHINLYSN